MTIENEFQNGRLNAAPIGRRLASLLYESLLLLAVLLVVSFPAAVLNALLPYGLPHLIFQSYLLCVVAGYFTWFWSHGGQTLAMKTWRFRVVSADGSALLPKRALLRVVVAGLFFGPASVGLVLLFFPRVVGPHITAWTFLPLAATLLWSRFDQDRQFLHDRLAGTRLVSAA